MSSRIGLLIVLVTLLVPSVSTLWALDTCGEADMLYKEGMALLDDSRQEASLYERALSLCPGLYKAHVRLGEVYLARGEVSKALDQFRKALELRDAIEPHLRIGEIYRILGRYKMAKKEFSHVLSVVPDCLEAAAQLEYLKKVSVVYDKMIEPYPGRIPLAIFARIPGMSLPRGAILADVQFNHIVQDIRTSVPASERVVRIDAFILGLRYGLTDRVSVGLMPKFLYKKGNLYSPELDRHIDLGVSGMGDTVVFFKYRLLRRARHDLSLFHLLSIPTGDSSAMDRSHQVGRLLPLGSGHFDFQPGLAYTTFTGRVTLHSSLSYLITGSRSQGDELRANLALETRVFHGLIASLELNYRWRGASRRRQTYQALLTSPYEKPKDYSITIDEKSGHALFMAPGFRFLMPWGLQLELGARFPVIRPGADSGPLERSVFHIGLVRAFF